MQIRRGFIPLVLVALAIGAVPAQAQSCTQGGPGPRCGVCIPWFDLAYDGPFSQIYCGAWVFGGNSSRGTDGGPCGWDNYYGSFNGPTNWTSFYQSVVANQGTTGNFFFVYDVDIDDSDPYTRLDVYIKEPNGNLLLIDTVSGARWCETRQVSLPGHSNWVNQSVDIVFWGKVVTSGKKIKIDRVVFGQY